MVCSLLKAGQSGDSEQGSGDDDRGSFHRLAMNAHHS